MYFWEIKELKKDLKKSTLSESDSFKYLMAAVISYGIATVPFLENSIWDVYNAIVIGLITIFGTYYAYKCNKGASGNNFIQRFLSLSWVAGIRWLVLFMLPAMIIYLILTMVLIGISETTTLIDVIFYSLMYIIYFWLLGKHIKDVANSEI